MSLFQTVAKPKIKRTAFNLSHERKQSMNLGKLTPILCKEVLPGDTWNIRTESVIKLAPMIAPVMHRITAYIHYFFVPNRIIWDDWEDFITGEKVTSVPKTLMGNTYFVKGTLADYLGFPAGQITTGNTNMNQLPFRAYWSIWNEYYRDQNLQTEIDLTALGISEYADCAVRSWQKDYFTSALPFAQKGAAVQMEGTEVTYKTTSIWNDQLGGSNSIALKSTAAGAELTSVTNPNSTTTGNIENIESFGIDINEFRTAHRLQRYLERLARTGTRYTEYLLGVFGVHNRDSRLNRPEFLGGGKQTVVVSEVLQTSESGTTEQGNPSGHGIAVGSTSGTTKRFTEHGHILGIMSITCKAAYRQGVDRMWKRQLNTDYFIPDFANLGEQAVLNQEVYLQGSVAPGVDEETFGYQSRYAEYKYVQDEVCGDFTDNLEFWHLGRKFSTKPSLNETFIASPTEYADLESRIFAAGRTAQPFWVQMYHQITAVRPMPYYGTPTI